MIWVIIDDSKRVRFETAGNFPDTESTLANGFSFMDDADLFEPDYFIGIGTDTESAKTSALYTRDCYLLQNGDGSEYKD